MRKLNSLKNIIGSVGSNIISILVGLVAQSIFLKQLGSEYLGLNGLFSNIISMLAIVEMGIGNAIIYSLYKPISENNTEKIKSLMIFYKKSYHLIGIIVGTIGLIILPFIPSIVGENSLNININFVFILFIFDAVFSYFLSYKRSILYANQKNYYINIVHILYVILLNTIQCIILYLFKNYYLYLILKIVFRILENLIITVISNSLYPYIKEKEVKSLDLKTKKDIFKKVKALFFHQVGSFIVNSTDNIVISRFIGLATVGLYSNYYLIINSVQTILRQIIQSFTPSIGNLLVTESKEKQFFIFKKIRFLNFVITVVSSVCIYNLMEPFIAIWIGKQYLLSKIVLFILVINFYQKTSRESYASFKTASGIFYEDRFIPVIESLLNIIFSIFLAKKIGLPGVFIGTIISGLSLWLYSYPKFVYKKVFNKKITNYYFETLGYISLFIIILFISNYSTNLVNISNIYLNLIVKAILSVIIPFIIIIIVFFNSENFKYYINLLSNIKSKKRQNI